MWVLLFVVPADNAATDIEEHELSTAGGQEVPRNPRK